MAIEDPPTRASTIQLLTPRKFNLVKRAFLFALGEVMLWATSMCDRCLKTRLDRDNDLGSSTQAMAAQDLAITKTRSRWRFGSFSLARLFGRFCSIHNSS